MKQRFLPGPNRFRQSVYVRVRLSRIVYSDKVNLSWSWCNWSLLQWLLSEMRSWVGSSRWKFRHKPSQLNDIRSVLDDVISIWVFLKGRYNSDKFEWLRSRTSTSNKFELQNQQFDQELLNSNKSYYNIKYAPDDKVLRAAFEVTFGMHRIQQLYKLIATLSYCFFPDSRTTTLRVSSQEEDSEPASIGIGL